MALSPPRSEPGSGTGRSRCRVESRPDFIQVVNNRRPTTDRQRGIGVPSRLRREEGNEVPHDTVGIVELLARQRVLPPDETVKQRLGQRGLRIPVLV